MKPGAPLAIVDPRGHTRSTYYVTQRLLKRDVEGFDALDAVSKHIEKLSKS
jgi:hypothetical protein